MKKNTFFPIFVFLFIIAIIITAATNFYSSDKDQGNENKNKLTLQNSVKKIPAFKNIVSNNLENKSEPTDNQGKSSDLLTKERIFTENEINELSENDFIELLKTTELRLPKLSDIKKIPSEALHHTPPIVIEAGRNLGVIKEILKIHESYERVATPFYKSCAKNEEGVTPVRALCLTNLIEIKKRNNQSLNLKEYPDKLLELSKMIIDI